MNLIHLTVPVRLMQLCLLIFIRSMLWQCLAPGWWPVPTPPLAVLWLVGECLTTCDNPNGCVICLVFCFVLVNNFFFLVTGAWIINAQCILCLWTRMRTWLRRRSQWPCIQTTCQPAASPTRICRWEYRPYTKTHPQKAIEWNIYRKREMVNVFPQFYWHFRFL